MVDFEVDTSHGDYGNPVHPDNELLLIRWRLGPDHPSFSAGVSGGGFGSESGEEAAKLLLLVEQAEFVVAHNAKYELGWFKRIGIPLRKVLAFDTKLAEYVLLGNLAQGAKELGMQPLETSLDMCCRRRGMPIKDPVVDTMMHNGINPVRMPQLWLEGRCKQDVDTTELVFLDQRRDLANRNLLPVLYTRCLLTPVLADIQSEGMALDPERVEAVHVDYSLQLSSLQQRMDELTGGINWRSSAQAAKFVYDDLGFKEVTKYGRPVRNKGPAVTKTGKPIEKRKTDKKTLDKLEAKTPEQKEYLTVRKELGKINAAISKSLDFYLGVVKEYGGTFYAELNQTSTATHRLSSTGIPLPFLMFAGKEKSAQFQNQPRIFKKLFKAKRPGWLIGEADGSSLEFRIAAELSRDKQAISDIVSGWDVHTFTASVLRSVSLDRVKEQKKEAEAAGVDDWRQLAKPDTFKPVYGGTKGTPEQERYYTAFRLRYPELAATQEGWVYDVLQNKRLVTPWGLVYYWPIARISSSGWINVTSSVYNYPIQGLATAEIIPIALVYFWHRMPEYGLLDHAYLVNTVHDSVASEIEPGYEEKFRELAKQSFTTDVYHYLETVYKMERFVVPLGVGIKVGTHWGTGNEEQWNIYPNGDRQRVK